VLRECRGEEKLGFNLKFEMLYSGSEVSVVHSKVSVAQ
jgi:hypothetical protein